MYTSSVGNPHQVAAPMPVGRGVSEAPSQDILIKMTCILPKPGPFSSATLLLPKSLSEFRTVLSECLQRAVSTEKADSIVFPQITSYTLDKCNAVIRGQIDELNRHLTREAQELFKRLLNLPPIDINSIDKHILLGDSDGSIARQILFGIHSGGIVIEDSIALKALATLMNAETETINEINKFKDIMEEEERCRNRRAIPINYDQHLAGRVMNHIEQTPTSYGTDAKQDFTNFCTAVNTEVQNSKFKDMPESTFHTIFMSWLFQKFQSSEANFKNIAIVFQAIQFQKCIRPAVCLGDCVFDRLSCGIYMEMLIRETLKLCGMQFIYGNHDVPVTFMSVIKNKQRLSGFQFACAAFIEKTPNPLHLSEDDKKRQFSPDDPQRSNLLSEVELNDHVNSVFSNAYYDEKDKILYMHHRPYFGIGELIKTIYIATPFINVSLASGFKAVSLVKTLNLRGKITDAKLASEFTKFRGSLKPQTVGPEQVRGVLSNMGIVRIVHGHESELNDKVGCFICLNSLLNGQFTVAAGIVGPAVEEKDTAMQTPAVPAIE